MKYECSKRDRAKLLGKVNFCTLRSPYVQKLIAPLYKILSSIEDWKAIRPIISLERSIWKQLIVVLSKQLAGADPNKLMSRLREPLFSDASEMDAGAKFRSRVYSFIKTYAATLAAVWSENS